MIVLLKQILVCMLHYVGIVYHFCATALKV